jgi:hypothetical protein
MDQPEHGGRVLLQPFSVTEPNRAELKPILRASEEGASVGAYLWITGVTWRLLGRVWIFFFHLLANKHARTLYWSVVDDDLSPCFLVSVEMTSLMYQFELAPCLYTAIKKNRQCIDICDPFLHQSDDATSRVVISSIPSMLRYCWNVRYWPCCDSSIAEGHARRADAVVTASASRPCNCSQLPGTIFSCLINIDNLSSFTILHFAYWHPFQLFSKADQVTHTLNQMIYMQMNSR